ncbi:MAG: response regulator [Polyangiaceae bacterium]|nr:response regulator [Polyangiaceae bacterium]MCW5789831.1 response regulator [Polyangiaceae bacterium]
MQPDGGGARYTLCWGNQAASDLFGVDLVTRVGETPNEVLPQFARSWREKFGTRSLAGPGSLELETIVDDDLSHTFSVRVLSIDVGKIAVVAEDITEARRIQAELDATAKELEDLYERSPIGHYSLDADGVFLRINDTALGWLGYTRSELVGRRRFPDLLIPEGRAQFERQFPLFKERGFVDDLEFDLVRNDGSLLPVLVSSTVLHDERGGYLRSRSTMLDLRRRREAERLTQEAFEIVEERVAERTRALALINQELEREVLAHRDALEALEQSERQLHHAQKMEAVGRLAGGVAHDFNNMLSVIIAFTDMVLGDLPVDDPRHDDLSQVLSAANQATALTRQLLTFSRQQLANPEPIDVDETLSELEKMLGRLIGENIRLATHFSSGARVLADRSQIEQAIVNLVVNARDAMPRGGRLILETSWIELNESYAEDHYNVAPGDYVLIAVSDTGVGIEKELISRIFEPFFTTKEAGKGTGLGLSMVYANVKRAGGHIWVYSEEGRGTTFKIYLPVLPSVQVAARPKISHPEHRGARDQEAILLLEDEDLVRAAVSAILTRDGYRVITPASVAEALRIAREGEPFALILTDIVMPEYGGPEMVAMIHEHRPGVPVIFMSGYSDLASSEHGIPQGAVFLQKPVAPVELKRKVREVLDAALE